MAENMDDGAADEGHGFAWSTRPHRVRKKDALFKTPGKSKNVKRESQGTASPFLKSTPRAPVVLPKNNQGVTTIQYAEEGHIDKCTVTAIRGGASHHRASLHVARGAPMVTEDKSRHV